jgi:hypothetical protein
MAEKSTLHKGVLRFIIIFILSMGVIWIFSEGTHWLLREDYDRNPQVVELVVPLGAAQRVAAGEPVPSIPDEMIFVVGDTLTVKNEDSVDHELGPLWVPAGSSASLVLDQPRKFMYTCSFQIRDISVSMFVNQLHGLLELLHWQLPLQQLLSLFSFIPSLYGQLNCKVRRASPILV